MADMNKTLKKRQELGFEMKEITEEVLVGCPKHLLNWLKYAEPAYRYKGSREEDWNFRTEFIRKLYNFTCASCKKTEEDCSRSEFHTHHIIPLSEGGDNAFENLVCLCEKCHKKIHPGIIFERII